MAPCFAALFRGPGEVDDKGGSASEDYFYSVTPNWQSSPQRCCGNEERALSDIDTIRALLTSKPRPVGWAERRQRLDEVGSTWPVADDIRLEAVDVNGVPGEW